MRFCLGRGRPQIGRELALHGATVIRVECHRKLDVLRTSSPFKDFKPGINRSGFYTCYNTQKYGVSVDYTRPRGQENCQTAGAMGRHSERFNDSWKPRQIRT